MTTLEMWTIYEHPLDYPDGFVVRRFTLDGLGAIPGEASYVDSLEAARAVVPPGLALIPRSVYDEVQIVESWL